jgi:hypothetical protein
MHYDTADGDECQSNEYHKRRVEEVVEGIDSWYPVFRIEGAEYVNEY